MTEKLGISPLAPCTRFVLDRVHKKLSHIPFSRTGPRHDLDFIKMRRPSFQLQGIILLILPRLDVCFHNPSIALPQIGDKSR
jgi:hypothetical protein